MNIIHNPTLQRVGIIAAIILLAGSIVLVSYNLFSSASRQKQTVRTAPVPTQPVVVEPKTYELEVSLEGEDIIPTQAPSPATEVVVTPADAAPSPAVIAQAVVTVVPTRIPTAEPTRIQPTQDPGMLPQAGVAQYSGVILFTSLLAITFSLLF